MFAVQSDASLARLRHTHPTATLRRLVGSGQIARYSTLAVEVADGEQLAVDHVVMQADSPSIGVRIDGRPCRMARWCRSWRRIRLPACPIAVPGPLGHR